jgi:CheY-like chemotaxis protein
MATKTLLVVDDEPLLRTYVRDLLEGAGYAVKEAADAHEAIRFLEDDGITAVLTDIEMPGALDGIDLAWMICIRWPNLPVVITSGKRLPRPGDLPANRGAIIECGQQVCPTFSTPAAGPNHPLLESRPVLSLAGALLGVVPPRHTWRSGTCPRVSGLLVFSLEALAQGAGGVLGCSVVGFGVGTAGEVEGDGAGVTVCTDGPALASPIRSVVGCW